MARRRILADLVDLPPNELRAQLVELQAEREQLTKQAEALELKRTHLLIEEQVLSQMLSLHQRAEQKLPGASETLAATTAAAPARREENLSANVLSIVQQADEPLRPVDVQARLAAVGVEATLSAVRVALRRWVDRGELTKLDRHYVRPDAPTLLSFPHHGADRK